MQQALQYAINRQMLFHSRTAKYYMVITKKYRSFKAVGDRWNHVCGLSFFLKLPHQEAVHDVVCELSNKKSEQVNMDLMTKQYPPFVSLPTACIL